MSRPFATLVPPPATGLAVGYLIPLMAPMRVATRLPKPADTEDVINGFLRVEAGGGSVMADEILFNVNIILHSYASNNDESSAELNMQKALAWAGNAQGTTLVHPSTQKEYFVTYSRISSLGHRQGDPLVNMARYRGMVTWRIRGEAIS